MCQLWCGFEWIMRVSRWINDKCDTSRFLAEYWRYHKQQRKRHFISPVTESSDAALSILSLLQQWDAISGSSTALGRSQYEAATRRPCVPSG